MKRRHLLREAVSKEQLDDAIETLKDETKYDFEYDAAEDVWKITDPNCNGRRNCGWKIANKIALTMRMSLDKFYEVYEPVVFDDRVEVGMGLFDTADDAEVEVAENKGYHQDRYGVKLSEKDLPPELSDTIKNDFGASVVNWGAQSRIPHLMILVPTMRHNPEYDTHTGRGRKPMEQIPNMTPSRRRELEAAIVKAGWKVVSMDSPGEISDEDEWVYEIAPKDVNQTEYFQVAESTKVTLTVGQIKKLVKESRLGINRMNESTDPIPGKKYDYYASVKSDLEDFIKDYIESGDITTREDLMADADRIKDEAVDSYVTGAGNGHYFNDSFKAEEALCHNWNLMQEVTEEWGDDELFKKSPSGVDISIRTYVLYMVFDGVLEQIANGYPSASDDIEVADYDDTSSNPLV